MEKLIYLTTNPNKVNEANEFFGKKYGFNYLNLNSVALHVMSFNERAMKCYKKCGFKEYGRRRQCVFVDGKYYDKVGMDILAKEFKESYIRNKNI